MTTPFSRLDGLRYGLLGLPLAFVALPLYVLLPNHYARNFGVPLAALGLVLLGARLVDALIDPLLGRLSDRLHARAPSAVLGFGAGAAVLLALGFGLLFFPQLLVDTSRHGLLLATAAVLLMLSYAGYSALSITHQAWGAMLGGDAVQRSRIVGWREGLGLAGVVVASVVPTLAGLPVMVGLFVLLLAAGWALWTRAPRPRTPAGHAAADLRLPFRRPAFRRLLAVFVLNGIASAIPATLVLFFVQDRLQAPESLQPAFLGSYFVCAALSIPFWLRIVPRLGLARTWLAGMALAVAVFAAASGMSAGDAMPFLVVCALSGVALGADLVLPGALLAGVLADAGEPQHAGAYFGWWNFATKLNLALAAGLALPLLGLAGYTPGARDAGALQALTAAYCLLPCLLKLLAAAALWQLLIRGTPQSLPLKVSP
ncbi:MFS transporter [Variovorax sp. J22G21]|uniref:MFS transporter n=1 Tax=Variovorax fucosicus TaxID=3053517 RepID=UPI002575CD42|nr:MULTISPECIES: MFS transporter [unclassified Variovorax]MDM0039490.1 MFS transporter [Variovorax sp. J22R193]MDM0054898.1 MFS transporter [Variovorax sp. J22G47]MDM0064265.1 MFS transporter [Variovorax sp. J22G21]